jgi:predicted kinase
MDKHLIVLVGLPLSGKSTIAKSESKKHGIPIVCPDSIRLALHGKRFIKESEPYVWAIATTMVKALFISGHDRVIVDATNTTKKRREFWINDSWKTVYWHIDTPVAECMKRAEKANDTVIIPVIERMNAQFEKLEKSETRDNEI